MRRHRPERPRSGMPALIRYVSATLIIAVLSGGWLARDRLPLTSFAPPPPTTPTPGPLPAGTYVNPLTVAPTDHGAFESCPDPAIIRGQQPGDRSWYMYCTTNPLNGNDRGESGRLNYHLIPMLQSADLVHWTYVGDVFTSRPSWLSGFALLWAPEIQYFNARYYLYYTATSTRLGVRGSAIGVATSTSPTGPWTDSGAAVVEPQPSATNRRAGRSIYDPAVVTREDGQRFLFYGGFDGGISARPLAADGLHTDPTADVRITVANRYEGVSIIKHDDYWYLFASAAECCNGALSSYSVFVGRSRDLLGPYLDRSGVSLLDAQVGGTPVLSANGNLWVGPGHNTIFTDRAGQDWFLYHAVDRDDPYFAGTAMTKRPVLLDPLDWIDGWPSVAGGLGPSDTPQPMPATQPDTVGRVPLAVATPLAFGPLDADLSDEFDPAVAPNDTPSSTEPGHMWQWVRPPPDGSFGLVDGMLRIATQPGDLEDHSAGILTEPTPRGDYAVETRLRLDLPPGCCDNAVQAGIVIYGDDTSYLKLVEQAHAQTRQTVFVNRVPQVSSRYPRLGSAVVGPPATWTYLRIVKRTRAPDETYTAYTSQDGVTWVQGTTWTHAPFGARARIGLVAMGGAGFTASFDYLHVSLISPAP